MQCAYAILLSVTYPALQFFHVTSTTTLFLNKVIGQKMRVSIFSTHLSETFFILGRTERDMMKMLIGLRVK